MTAPAWGGAVRPRRGRSVVPGEYHGGTTLLKVCDQGTLFLGTDDGHVLTSQVLSGGSVPTTYKRAHRAKEAAALARMEKRYGLTVGLHRDGAMVGRARRLVIQEFYDPQSRQTCVAGWDGTAWVVP